MRKILFSFLFVISSFQAQTIDTDHDGIPDIEDQCPTAAGIRENYGCPETIRKNCAYFLQKDADDLIKFKQENQNIENIYNLINTTILDDVPKKLIGSSSIYLRFIDNNSPCDQAGRCCSELYLNQYNFLIAKFWNEDSIEQIFRKYKSSIVLSSKVPKPMIGDYKTELSSKLFTYLIKHYDENEQGGRFYVKSKRTEMEKNTIPIAIEFKNPYQITISYLDKIKKYEYKNQKWDIIPPTLR